MKFAHISVFLLGWTYYLISPHLIGELGFFGDMPVAWLWSAYYPIEDYREELFGFIALMPILFFCGSVFGSCIRLPTLTNTSSTADLVLVPGYAVALVAFAIEAREYLFTGYTIGVDAALAGPLSALQTMCLFSALVALDRRSRSIALYGLILLVNSTLLLSMGGRLLVLTTAVAVLFYLVAWRGFSAKVALAVVAVFAFGLAAFGMIRLGDGLEADQLTYFFFAEALLASISGTSLVTSGEWDLFALPMLLFAALANVVPSFLWPGKLEYMETVLAQAYYFDAPLGAMSIVASAVGGFGYIGGLLLIAFVGFVIGVCARNASGSVSRALYAYLVASLLFVFFRDPLYVQIKVVLTGFLLVLLYNFLALLELGLKWRRKNVRAIEQPGS